MPEFPVRLPAFWEQIFILTFQFIAIVTDVYGVLESEFLKSTPFPEEVVHSALVFEFRNHLVCFGLEVKQVIIQVKVIYIASLTLNLFHRPVDTFTVKWFQFSHLSASLLL
jgi:hypothetical protein